ncbi:MAG TPA: efflux RND transporter permease subunit, partial [Bdellovibrionota bacterium]|nr:efflux RND transporter permease subunit [Bdellovibrionota bacterium]
MRISEAAIKNPVGAWMLMAALILFGWISFGRMGVSQLPDVDSPVVSVNVTLPGAAPEVMEMDVLDPLEEGLLSVQGILTMSSTARTGSASITLEFDLKKDINVAVAEIQTAVAQAMRHLPDDVEPPVVRKSNPEDQPILWMALTSDRLSQEQLMAYVRDNVRDRFNTLEGVSEVFLGGYVEPTLQVQLSSKELEKRYLTADDVITAVQHEHVELPSGHIVATDQEFNVRTMGEAPNPEAFSQLPIIARAGAPNFRPAKLGDVATIRYGLGEIRRISRSNGHLAVGLGIKKQAGTNAVEVAHRVKAKMAEVQSQLPEGMKLSVRFDNTQFIKEAVHELNFTLLLSAGLTALVCWLFLGSLSATINIVMAIPVSVVGSFIALYAVGFTLNTFTLLGLSLAIGIVVDDAIMVLENIVRHHEDGKNRLQASLDGSKEIGFAALAATAAIIAIFLPVAFMKGIVGRYFYQ